jgi:tight adherence protein B
VSATALCLAVVATVLWPSRGQVPWPDGRVFVRGPDGGGLVRRPGPDLRPPQPDGEAARHPGAARRQARRVGRSRAGHGRRAGARLQGDLADFLSLLAAALRVGTTPALALVTVARAMSPGPELRALLVDLAAADPGDSGSTAVWLRHAERLDSEDLRFVGRAWQLTERTGAPLAEALVSVERVLRTRQRARERLATAAAGPRSSMAVLVALPCAGPLVGLAFGVGPVALYLSSAAALASAVLGVVLGLLAWVWARRIIGGALRTDSSAAGRVGAR